MNKLLLVVSCVVSLSGCTSVVYQQQMDETKRKDAEFALAVKNINVDSADVGETPEDHKKIIEDAIRNILKDPDSAKFSELTPPRKEVIVENNQFVYGYSSCVNVNAKNSYGGYAGKTLYWVFYRDNKVLRVKNTNDAYGDIIFVGRQINCNLYYR